MRKDVSNTMKIDVLERVEEVHRGRTCAEVWMWGNKGYPTHILLPHIISIFYNKY